MNRTRFYLIVFLVLALTITSGVVAGKLGNRWGEPVDLLAAGERIAKLPEQFGQGGQWQLEHAEPLDPDVVEMLQCVGHSKRRYVNRKTGATISLFVIVGPPGPTSVHTPEICYSSRDYLVLRQPQRFHVAGVQRGEEAFWGMTFRSNSVGGHILRVAHAWNNGNGWYAPDQPRITYGVSPLLYKLQLAAYVSSLSELDEADPCEKFLQDFLPELDKALFPKS